MMKHYGMDWTRMVEYGMEWRNDRGSVSALISEATHVIHSSGLNCIARYVNNNNCIMVIKVWGAHA